MRGGDRKKIRTTIAVRVSPAPLAPPAVARRFPLAAVAHRYCSRVMAKRYFYVAQCPEKAFCSDKAWKRAQIWGYSEEECRERLRKHLVESSLHLLNVDVADDMAKGVDLQEEPYESDEPGDEPRERSRKRHKKAPLTPQQPPPPQTPATLTTPGAGGGIIYNHHFSL